MTDFERNKNGKQMHYLCAEVLQLDTVIKLTEPYMTLPMQAGEGGKYLHEDVCGS